jgi:hypothetical protein
MWLVVRYSSVLCVNWIGVACGQLQQWTVCGLDSCGLWSGKAVGCVWIGLMWLVVRYSSGLCGLD